MKKFNLLFVLLLAVAFVACKDDDDKAPAFKKEAFLGVWEENGSEEDGCTSLIKFDDTNFYGGDRCSGVNDFDSGISYTFDNKQTIIMNTILGEVKYVIVSLNATTFKADGYWAGSKVGTFTYTKLN